MNEQFFTIALKAIDFHGAVDTDTELKLTNSQLQKFAELIVLECLSIVEPDVGMSCGDEWYTTLEATAQEIKEHFGLD